MACITSRMTPSSRWGTTVAVHTGNVYCIFTTKLGTRWELNSGAGVGGGTGVGGVGGGIGVGGVGGCTGVGGVATYLEKRRVGVALDWRWLANSSRPRTPSAPVAHLQIAEICRKSTDGRKQTA